MKEGDELVELTLRLRLFWISPKRTLRRFEIQDFYPTVKEKYPHINSMADTGVPLKMKAHENEGFIPHLVTRHGRAMTR